MIEPGGAPPVVRRPSMLALVAALALVGLGVGALATRDRPVTPEDREGRSTSPDDRVRRIEEVDLELATASTTQSGSQRLIIAASGQLLIRDLSTGLTTTRDDDLPVTQPLVGVSGGVVAVTRGTAVFIPASDVLPAAQLGPATEVFTGQDTEVWLSHNNAGPAYVDKLNGPEPGGVRFPLGSGVLVHGLADSGLLLGRSGSTQVVTPGTEQIVADLPTFTEVLSIRGDVVAGIDNRCGEQRCSLLIVDAATGVGGEWEMGEFRMPNQPSAELSPDGSHLALFVVDGQRNLAVGVLDLGSGEFRRGAIVGSSRRSGDVSWSRDGQSVFYVDPEPGDVVRELRPFDDQPSDVVIATDLGKVFSVAELS